MVQHLGGNYLSSVAVCEVVDILDELKKSGDLEITSLLFNKALEEFYNAHKDVFTSKVGIGMMCGLRTKDAETLAKIINSARENGVMVLKAGRNTLRFLPPLTITKEEMDEGFENLEKALQNIL